MGRDKHETERFELTSEISRVEAKETAFSQLKIRYEHGLDHFYDRFKRLADLHEAVLGANPEFNYLRAANELAENNYFNQRMAGYVNDQSAVLNQVSRQIRESMNEEREGLIQERNGLPWE